MARNLLTSSEATKYSVRPIQLPVLVWVPSVGVLADLLRLNLLRVDRIPSPFHVAAVHCLGLPAATVSSIRCNPSSYIRTVAVITGLFL